MVPFLIIVSLSLLQVAFTNGIGPKSAYGNGAKMGNSAKSPFSPRPYRTTDAVLSLPAFSTQKPKHPAQRTKASKDPGSAFHLDYVRDHDAKSKSDPIHYLNLETKKVAPQKVMEEQKRFIASGVEGLYQPHSRITISEKLKKQGKKQPVISLFSPKGEATDRISTKLEQLSYKQYKFISKRPKTKQSVKDYQSNGVYQLIKNDNARAYNMEPHLINSILEYYSRQNHGHGNSLKKHYEKKPYYYPYSASMDISKAIIQGPKYDRPLTVYRNPNHMRHADISKMSPHEAKFMRKGEIIPVSHLTSTSLNPTAVRDPNGYLFRIDLPANFPGLNYNAFNRYKKIFDIPTNRGLMEYLLPHTLDPTMKTLNYGFEVRKVDHQDKVVYLAPVALKKPIPISDPSLLSE